MMMLTAKRKNQYKAGFSVFMFGFSFGVALLASVC